MVGKGIKKVTDNQVQKMMSGLVMNHNDIGASSAEFQSESMLQRLPQVVIVVSSSLILPLLFRLIVSK